MTTATETRTDEVLQCVGDILNAHDLWENDRFSSDIPAPSIDLAAAKCVELCCSGEIPGPLSGLVILALDFAERWQLYRENDSAHCDRRTKKPTQKVWSAFRELRRARDAFQRPDDKRHLESVTELKRQKLDHAQIARCYGVRDERTDVWSGPFFDQDGKPRIDLIEQQFRAENGEGERVVPVDFSVTVPPESNLSDVRQLSQKISRFQEKISPLPPPKDKGTPESLALEGAFPHQIMGAFNMTSAEVDALLQRLGLAPKSPEIPEVQPTAGDELALQRRIEEAQARKMEFQQSSHDDDVESESDADVEDEGDQDAEALSDDAEPLADDAFAHDAEFERLALHLHASDDSLGAPDIARTISEELGRPVSAADVASILKRSRQPV